MLADKPAFLLIDQLSGGPAPMELKSPSYPPPDVGQAVDAALPEPTTTEVTVDRGGPGNPAWQKGMRSPNPAGRPPAIRERKAKIHERMLDEAGAVIDVMLQKALEGDASAAALVVNRVLPVLRPQSEKVTFTLHVDQPVSRQVEQVLAAVAKGEVAPDVGKRIVEMVQALSNVRVIEDLEQRIVALEGKQA